MRLSDLKPRWVGLGRKDHSETGPDCLIGLTFLCPCCQQQRIGVMFKPFIDPDNFAARAAWKIPQGDPQPVWWNREGGETFDTLTVFPSVDASGLGHWHGFIRAGEAL